MHPEVADTYGIGERAYVAVLDMPEIFHLQLLHRKYAGIAKYPAVTRDISMVVPKEILVGQIEEVIEKKAEHIWKATHCLIYMKEARSKQDSNTVAYSIVFRAKDKTLEEADVTSAMNRILKALEEMGIELRK